jgi:hypothetical protein
MRKILAMGKSRVLLIILIAIVGGIAGYFWYDTRAHLKQIMTVLKPFAEVRYSSIYASPFGSAGIKGLEILPYGIDAKFLVDKVSLQGNNLFSLLAINRAFEQGRLPKSTQLILEDVQIPIGNPFLENPFDNSSFQLPFEFTLCGEIVSFSATEFQALGYDDALHLDLSLAYNINELRPSMELTVKFNPQAMLAITTKAELTLPQATLSLTDLMTLSPRLTELIVVLKDLSLVKRLNSFCAKKENMNVATYIEEQVEYLQHRLRSWGILLGNDLTDFYREFMTQGGQIKITASPRHALPLQELTSQSLKDILDRLNLAIAVNHLPATPLSLEFHDPETFSYSKKEITSDTIRFQQQENMPKYRSIAYEELADYLGSQAIIYTVNGSEHKGKLEAINHNTVKLVRQMHGGSIAFTINIYDIKKVLIAP